MYLAIWPREMVMVAIVELGPRAVNWVATVLQRNYADDRLVIGRLLPNVEILEVKLGRWRGGGKTREKYEAKRGSPRFSPIGYLRCTPNRRAICRAGFLHRATDSQCFKKFLTRCLESWHLIARAVAVQEVGTRGGIYSPRKSGAIPQAFRLFRKPEFINSTRNFNRLGISAVTGLTRTRSCQWSDSPGHFS